MIHTNDWEKWAKLNTSILFLNYKNGKKKKKKKKDEGFKVPSGLRNTSLTGFASGSRNAVLPAGG